MRRLVLPLALGLAAGGCATTYVPQPGPRVSVIMTDGKPAYVRDGRTIEAGFFGAGLVEAVRGVPQAEDHARSFRDRNTTGFATVLAGAGIAIGGVVVAADAASQHDSRNEGLGWAVAAGGLAIELVGAAIAASAQPHQLDALNVYNDAVEGRGPRSRWERGFGAPPPVAPAPQAPTLIPYAPVAPPAPPPPAP